MFSLPKRTITQTYQYKTNTFIGNSLSSDSKKSTHILKSIGTFRMNQEYKSLKNLKYSFCVKPCIHFWYNIVM